MSKPTLKSSLWSWLAYRKWFSNDDEPRLSADGTISGSEQQRILGVYIPTIRLFDNKVRPAHIGEIIEIGQKHKVGTRKYVPDLDDCDDAGLHLLGLCNSTAELAAQAIYGGHILTPPLDIYDGKKEEHFMVLVITRTGVKLIECYQIMQGNPCVHDFSEGYKGRFAFG